LLSTRGEGSTFTCYLPHALPQEATEPGSQERFAHERRGRLLSVEADDILADSLGAQLHEAGSDTTRVTSASNVELAGRKILIVDDDMRTVYALSALLCAKGVAVQVADTGHAALSVLAEHPDVELVLMDIMMPEMDGFEAMRRIRQQERLRTLPIIALTAEAMQTDRAQCMEAGATDYLPKPLDADRLLAMIQHRLVPEAAA